MVGALEAGAGSFFKLAEPPVIKRREGQMAGRLKMPKEILGQGG